MAGPRPVAAPLLRRLRRCDAGNTLVLFPAAVLIVLGLGALALDSATVFLGQRRLVDIAAAVANDALAAVDPDAFFDQEPGAVQVPIDPWRAEQRLDAVVAAQVPDRSLSDLGCAFESIEPGPPTRVAVRCTATVRPILAPVWPGAPKVRPIMAREVAVGVQR